MKSNPSALFIHRPVMTTVVMSALLVFGLVAYQSLPVSELPNVSFPTIYVDAGLPGASPQTMASTVATPLERQFSSIQGLRSMSSQSTMGNTFVTLQFNLSRNINNAAMDVQAAISQSLGRLPPNLPQPPTLFKANPTASPIVFLGLTARHIPMTVLDKYAETRVAERISMISGVSKVDVFGGQTYAVRLEMNPYALAARGLTLTQVASAVEGANSNVPAGTLYGRTSTYTVLANGQLRAPAQYGRIIVAYRNGAPVYLSSIGRAVASVAANKQVTRFFNKSYDHGRLRPAILLAVQRQPNSNAVDISRAIIKILPTLSREAPGGARLQMFHDHAAYVLASIHEVQNTLLIAMVLVVAVIFLFLRDIRATLISALALPLSIIGTFALMKLAGFSLDNLSLMALTLAVGFVVDDAVVVLENIVRHREAGEPRLKAALIGSREIAFTVVSMTLSLVAVFLPILLLGGMLGRLFREFALTVAFAILISGLVSLTLTPMLCSRFLRGPGRHGRLYQILERSFDTVRDAYVRSLRWAVTHWRLMLVVGTGTLVLTIYLFLIIPKGFIPTEDTGLVIASVEAPEGITFHQLRHLQDRVAKIVRANPAVARAISSVGQGRGGAAGGNVGRLFIMLKRMSKRHESATRVVDQLRRSLSVVHQVNVYFRLPSAINVGTLGGNAGYEYVLQGVSLRKLDRAASAFLPKLRTLPGLEDVSSDLEIDNPELKIHILRRRAAALGVTPQVIQQTLYEAYGGNYVSLIYGATNEYQVILELAPRYQQNLDALNALYVPTSGGGIVPLTSVARVRPSVGPLQIDHYEQLPSVTFSFNLAPGVSLGRATARIKRLAARVLPAGVDGRFAGNAKAFEKSLVSLPLLLLVTILVIYMVLAILYEHFIHPLTILSALPLAIMGALLTLLVFHEHLDIYSFVGLIMLVGLVKKNGIIMVDFAIGQRRQGQSPIDAIVEACRVRFRPIMMTTLAAILGVLPIAVASGTGAGARRPLGVAVVGGLIFSQLLTLYITPAFYVAMEELTLWLRRSRTARVPSLPVPTPEHT